MGSIAFLCKGYARDTQLPIVFLLKTNGINGFMNAQSDVSMKTDEVLRVELEVFRREHRDLDDAIHALSEKGTADQLTLQRLKKRKLRIKDKIAQIEDRLTPDIIA
jgi:hypothetical protein